MGLNTPSGMVLTAFQQHSSFRYMMSHLLFLSLILELHYPLNLTRNSREELFLPELHQWGVASLETKAGRARPPQLQALRRDGTASLQGGNEGEAGLQDNWHSMPLSHTSIQRESLTHCYYTVVTCWEELPAAPRAALTAAGPRIPAAVLSHSANQFSSPYLCYMFKTSQKRSHPTVSLLTITSPEILHFSSQFSLRVTILSSSRHWLGKYYVSRK